MGNNISYQTILAAKAGDPIAMEQVLRNYDSYITMCAQRTMTDEYGNQSNEADNRVNEDETYILDFTGQQGGDNERHQGTCGIVGLHDGRVRPACIFFCEVLRAV